MNDGNYNTFQEAIAKESSDMSAISENGVCAVKDKACVISPLAHSFSQLLLNGELSHLDSMDMDLLSILAQNIGDD